MSKVNYFSKQAESYSFFWAGKAQSHDKIANSGMSFLYALIPKTDILSTL
jgi:hypothetical protein